MAYLAREIARAKWDPKPDLGAGEISADTFKDLRTDKSKLSLWTFPNSALAELEEIALAMATTRTSIEKLDLAWVEKKILDEKGILFGNEPGSTPVAELRAKHLNAVSLDVVRIAEIAKFVADAVRNKNQFRRFSTAEIKKIIVKALEEKRLRLEDLNSDLKRKIEELLGKHVE